MNDYPVRTEQQIALLIKSFRKAKGLTQAEVAHALGVTQQSASALERNPAAASVGRLMRTLSALGVELVLRDKAAPAPGVAVAARTASATSPAKGGGRGGKKLDKPHALDW